MQTKALVLSGFGFCTETETKYSIEKVGGTAEIVHVNELLEKKEMLEKFNFLVIPGGSTFGDSLGEGKIMADKLRYNLGDKIIEFIKSGNLILGIANGFQILIRAGLLPIPDLSQRLTTTRSNEYENRWSYFKVNKESPCVFTKNVEKILLPIRSKSRRIFCKDEEVNEMLKQNLHVLQYCDDKGRISLDKNKLLDNVAGICDKTGRVFGIMPHPESFCFPENCPAWIFGINRIDGLKIFENAVKYFEGI